jgi:cation transport protein ChaC
LTPLSEAEMAASVERALAGWKPRRDFWLFAYGSLMWNPSFPTDRRVPAHVFGYHRSFCLWSRINRGTRERPGLVLALARGGSCRGFALRVPGRDVHAMMPALWKREMTYGSYAPRWLPCHLEGGKVVQALAFVINPQASGYACGLDDEERAACMAHAAGCYGTAADYLFRTVESLDALGIVDSGLHALAQRVRTDIGRKR